MLELHSLIEKAFVYQAENCLLSRGESINSRPFMRQDTKEKFSSVCQKNTERRKSKTHVHCFGTSTFTKIQSIIIDTCSRQNFTISLCNTVTILFLADLQKLYYQISDNFYLNQIFRLRYGGCKESILVQTHKCSLLIMGLHIFEVKLC